MKTSGRVRYLIGLTLLFAMLGGPLGGQAVLAAQKGNTDPFLPPPNEEQLPEETEEQPAEERFELIAEYPVIRGESGSTFEFLVSFEYESSETRIFKFYPTVPPGWEISIQERFEAKEGTLLAVRLEPKEYYESLKVILSPLPGNLPEPGEYVVTLEIASDNMKDSVDLKAVVTELPPTYELDVVTTTGRLNTLAKAAADNTMSIKLTNSGTGIIEDITFSSIKSEGWGVTFTPNKIESLEPGQTQEVDVVITPPSRTIAGDYRVTLTARGIENVSDSIALRVRVETATMWGGVGIGIIAAVIAGLVVLFRRLGRR